MSIGFGIIGGVANSTATQKAADSDRAQQTTTQQQRQTDSAQHAENAAGIAETDGQDNNPNERDADGRRPWELDGGKRKPKTGDAAATEAENAADVQSKDPEGLRGQQLDLTG